MSWLETRIPPVIVLALWAAAGWVGTVLSRGLALDVPGRGLVALVLAGLGIAVAVAGLLVFRRVRTSFDPMSPDKASVLAVEGIFRFTRNPMYLGMALVLAGWAAWLAHPAGLLSLAGFVAYMDRFQIQPEERALSAKFGTAFDEYRRGVRRWL